jgi:hypothetical protein
MALQGSAIGFKTDKAYPEDVVRDALIEATMSGVYPVGNEFNIIAGRAYITKEGFGRKLKDVPSLSYTVANGEITMKNGGAIVPMDIQWTYGGKSEAKTLPVHVRVNSGMGADAIIGKATRKARAWLYQTVTGQELPEGDVTDASEPINVTPKASPFESVKPEAPATPKPTTAHAPVMDERPFLDRLFQAAAEAGITHEELNVWSSQRYGADTPMRISSSNVNRMANNMRMEDVLEAVRSANAKTGKNEVVIQ